MEIAAEKCSPDIVRLLVDEGGEVTLDVWFEAIGNRKLNPDFMRYLLSTNPKMINENDYGDTVLSCAAREGRPELVKLFINEGAEVTFKALWMAIWSRKPNIDVVRCLLAQNKKIINAKDSRERWTPLALAAHEGKKEIIELLVDEGAEVNYDVLFNAIGNDKLGFDVVSYLLGKLNQNSDIIKAANNDESNQLFPFGASSLLALAAYKKDLDTVKLLVEKYKFKVTSKVLLMAVIFNKVENVDYLIDQNPELLDDKNCEGQKRFKWVWKKYDNDELIRCLRKYDNVTIDTLLDAIKNDKVRVAAYLLNKKPDIINDADEKGQTPLSLAVKRGNLDIVKLLVEKYKAKVNLEALKLADESGNQDVIEFLKNFNKDEE